MNPKVRKRYVSPRLKTYGSVRDLTRATGDKNKEDDNAKGFWNKT